jgi:hypothetical protein
MQSILSESIEELRSAFAYLDEAKMNSHNQKHYQRKVNEGFESVLRALKYTKLLEQKLL